MESLEDRIFFNFQDAVNTFIRMDFEFIKDKRLVRNNLEVSFQKVGTDMWRSSVFTRREDADEQQTDPKILFL